MISTKRLVEIARKGQKVAAAARARRISFSKSDAKEFTTSVARKGKFVVYTTDGLRFEVPLEYLNSPIFLDLLKMSEEEFGLRSSGPITLPCDTIFMEYIVSLVQRCGCRNVAMAVATSITTSQCSISSFLNKAYVDHNVLLHGH